MSIYDEEIILETKSLEDARLKYSQREALGKTIGLTTSGLIIQSTLNQISEAIKVWSEGSVGKAARTRRWLRELSLDEFEISFIVLSRMFSGLVDRGGKLPSLTSVAQAITNDLVAESHYRAFVKAGSKDRVIKAFRSIVEENLKLARTSRHKVGVLTNAAIKSGVPEPVERLDQGQSVLLGTGLIGVVCESTGLFTRLKKRQGKGYKLFLAETPELDEWIKTTGPELARLSCTWKPMVIPPVPWRPGHQGGYICHPRPYRLITGYRRGIPDPGPQVYQAVNIAQATPWRINKRILEIQQGLSERRLEAAGMVDPYSSMAEAPKLTREAFLALTGDEKWEWKKQRAYAYQAEAAQRCDKVMQSMRLQQAEEYKDYESIYFPHCLDFRGRLYPIPVVLSPQGSDQVKSLLEFSEPGELNEDSINWLMIHIANCWGEDKVPFAARINWVAEHQDDILYSTGSPFDNTWWHEADKPLCFLAACFEYVDYLNGISTETRIPVAQDGTCSGLQHYSALLLDDFGAYATNLKPTEQPQDIYALVADKAEARLDQLIRTTKDDEMRHHALAWQGKVTRKVTKRNVMTTPYGVTGFGATDQLQGVLKDGVVEIATDNEAKSCSFLAKIIRQAIEDVVVSAAHGMDWLKDCARLITVETGMDPQWTTPVGMVVRHIYRIPPVRRIKTLFGGTTIQLSVAEESKKKQDPVNVQKNALGIAPNVIHSLDASHLVSTVIQAAQNDIKSFALIHDSFGVHADKVDLLRSCIKDTFVHQYRGNWFQDLKTQWESQYSITLPDPPEQGSLDIQQVNDSEYLFN